LENSAKEKAAQSREAAASGDFVDMGNAFFALGHVLDDMGELREVREFDWRGILNFLQGILKKSDPESFSINQWEGIETIVTDYLGLATVDKDDVESCLNILCSKGLDPWRPMSESRKEG
jgi:hypothetical protein